MIRAQATPQIPPTRAKFKRYPVSGFRKGRPTESIGHLPHFDFAWPSYRSKATLDAARDDSIRLFADELPGRRQRCSRLKRVTNGQHT